MKTTLFTTWPMIPATHASTGNGTTLCGKPTTRLWEEGGFIDVEDDDGISCLRCQAAMRKIAANESGGSK